MSEEPPWAKSIHNTNIPASSRVKVKKRCRERCERCGGPGVQWHHRRRRGVVAPHRHCPCNGVWLCDACHRHVHANPTESRVEGFIVRSTVENPGLLPIFTTQGWVYSTCDGRYATKVSAAETREEKEDGTEQRRGLA